MLIRIIVGITIIILIIAIIIINIYNITFEKFTLVVDE